MNERMNWFLSSFPFKAREFGVRLQDMGKEVRMLDSVQDSVQY